MPDVTPVSAQTNADSGITAAVTKSRRREPAGPQIGRTACQPFVPLLKDTLASPAWRAMSHGAKALYVSLKARYNSGQHNNGRVFVSQRTASQRDRIELSAEIARWFRELQYYGFSFRRRAEASASTARALHRTGD